jgi:shikimate kinase
MAAGKTEVARVLSRELGWPSCDVDALIEEEAGVPVAELFASRGESWFREREGELTAELLDRRGVIVAPGGGWAAREGRLSAIPDHVVSVWLRVSAAEAIARARRRPGERPLMADEEEMTALLREREPHYRQAQLHLDTESTTSVAVARRIIDHLAQR